MTRSAVLGTWLTAACLALAAPAAVLAQDEPAPGEPAKVAGAPEHGPPPAKEAAPPTGDAALDDALARARRQSADNTGFDEGEGYRDLVLAVTKGKPSADAPDLKGVYKAVLAYPTAYTGSSVKVLGLVPRMSAVRLAVPIEGRDVIWRGFIANTNGDEPIVFDMLDKPAEFRYLKDVIEVEGVFWRTVSFETQKDSFREFPYVIARSARVFQSHQAASSNAGGTHWLLAAAALAAGVALVVVLRLRKPVRAQPTTAAGFRSMLADAQHRRNVQKPGPQDPKKEAKEGPDAQV